MKATLDLTPAAPLTTPTLPRTRRAPKRLRDPLFDDSTRLAAAEAHWRSGYLNALCALLERPSPQGNRST